MADAGVGHHRRSPQQRHLRRGLVRPHVLIVGHVVRHVQQGGGGVAGQGSGGGDH